MRRIDVFICYENLLIADALQCFVDRNTHFQISGRCHLEDLDDTIPSELCSAGIVIFEVDKNSKDFFPMIEKARAKNGKARFMLISDIGKDSLINHFLRNGVTGYLLRCCTSRQLFMMALEKLKSGKTFYCSEVTESLLSEYDTATSCNQSILTEREFEILRHMAEELTTHQIASKLFLSPSTVKTHRRNIMRKLKARNVLSLLRSSVEQGILSRNHLPLCKQCDIREVPCCMS